MNKLSHIAIIMDGNGRWAKKRNKSRNYGHKIGLNNLKSILSTCVKNKIKFLSLYVFSFNNWKRSDNEIVYLFNLLNDYLSKDINYLIKNKIRIKIIGEKSRLEKKLIRNFKRIQKLTSKKFNITVYLAFNYSSKIEIAKSLKKIKNKKLKLTTKNISNNLYTSTTPDPEILIRTGGYCRLSDFMLWQIAYSEIFFIKKFWPDFNTKDLELIIRKYKKIKRNFGNV